MGDPPERRQPKEVLEDGGPVSPDKGSLTEAERHQLSATFAAGIAGATVRGELRATVQETVLWAGPLDALVTGLVWWLAGQTAGLIAAAVMIASYAVYVWLRRSRRR